MPSASNILYNGDACGFEHAMELVMAECNLEMVGPIDEEDHKLNASLERYRAAAQRCLDEYREHLKPLAERWKADPDEAVRTIAAALETGDYSQLAI